ncbi:MAG: hypothetical protein ACOYM2_00405 [Rectinemataceae bacterium]
MKRIGIFIITLYFGAGLGFGVFAFDLGYDLGFEGSVPASMEAQGTLVGSASLGMDLPASLYLKLEVTDRSLLWSLSGPLFTPLDTELLGTFEYLGDAATLGLTAGFKGSATFGSGANPGQPRFGAFVRSSLPLVGDLLSLDGELRATSDLGGVYGRLELAPTAYLPLDPPLMVELKVLADGILGNYGNAGGTGLSSLTFGPGLTVALGPSLSSSLFARYCYVFPGDRLRALGSTVEVGALFSASVEGLGK